MPDDTLTVDEYNALQSQSTTEDDIQKAVVKWARMQNDPALQMIMHVPNGGARDARTGARLKAMGTRRGVPDLLVPWPKIGAGNRGPYHGLWLELKRHDGRVRPEQAWWLERLAELGYAVAVAYSYDQATSALDEYVGGRWAPRDLDLPEPEQPE